MSFPAVLAPANWTKREDLAALVAALGAENVRWVGGAVRDTLLGNEAKDVDAATTLLPQAVIEKLREANIRTVPTGIEHGTVTALLPNGNVEVTTLRHDVSTDGRRATVAFANDWREDAARRDFTFNALYAHPLSLGIDDYFGGLDDLAARRVRFIGDARQRIREDHLRILRYYRFQARFGSELDAQAEEACAELATTLQGLSRERVSSELLNLLALPDPSATVARMHERGVLRVILPEAGPEGVADLQALVEQEASQSVVPHAARRLAALLPAEPRVAEQVAARLRLSNNLKKRLASAAARYDHPGDARALAYVLGRTEAVDRLLLSGCDVSPLNEWTAPIFPLKGGAVVTRGVSAGPEVARILQTIEARWIAEGFPDEQRVREMLEEALA